MIELRLAQRGTTGPDCNPCYRVPPDTVRHGLLETSPFFKWSAMKTKTKSKARKKTLARTKAKTKPRRSTKTTPRPTIASPSLTSSSTPKFKTCEEGEVGDIGGFGSTEELESHEERCSQQATEFCNTCARDLCRNHFELLHRDHDSTDQQSTSRGLAQS